jgi:hypothetical protein
MFNIMVREALKRRGTYYYFFPEFAQGRRVIWEGIDGSGFKFLDHIPEPLIQSKNGTDMRIILTNGSVIQIMGTDKFDKVRGSNPVGCVFSEYAFQNPKAWNIIRPILTENKGWAIFNSSTNGKNHMYELYERVKDNDKWFVQNLNVLETLDEKGDRYISDELIDEERASGMSEELVQQEFFNSWTANSQGYYYLSMLEDLENEGRISSVPHNPSSPVEIYFDIGVGDSTACWFIQTEGNNINVIDFYKNSNKGLDHYAKIIQSKRYVYSAINFPWDMRNIEFGTGKTRYEVAEDLFKGIRLNTVSKLPISEGINAVRMVLPSCRFDKVRCREGLDALKNYKKVWNDKQQVFSDSPLHDWASDAADAFRYLAIGVALPRSKAFRSDIIKKEIKSRVNRNWKTQ